MELKDKGRRNDVGILGIRAEKARATFKDSVCFQPNQQSYKPINLKGG
jgi:hypothetical protein